MAWFAEYTNGYASSYGFADDRNIANMSEAQIGNAFEVYNQLSMYGWSVNAIAAVVSNMLSESYINPGQREHQYSLDTLIGGYGLCQWTDVPSQGVYNNTVLHNWLNSNGYALTDGYAQVEFLDGMDNYLPGQWISNANSGYLSWNEFRTSQLDPATLARYFFYGYERGTWNVIRESNANYFYQLFSGVTPVPPSKSRRKMPIYFYLKPQRR